VGVLHGHHPESLAVGVDQANLFPSDLFIDSDAFFVDRRPPVE